MCSRPSCLLVVLVAVVLLGALFYESTASAGSPAYSEHFLRGLGCRLTLPSHWTAEKRGRALVFSGAKGSGEYETTISLQVTGRQAYPDLTAVAADYVAQWSRNPGYRLLARKQGTVGGLPAVLLLARYRTRGREFQQEQVAIQRGVSYYLIGYTAPLELFERGRPHMDRALASLRFTPPEATPGRAPARPAQPLRREQMSVAAYGPALLRQLQGPLYSHAFANGTPQGKVVAEAHNKIVAELARALAAQARAQKPALEWLARLGDLQAEQMALLEGSKAGMPAAGAWWARARAMFKLQMDYTLARNAQRGAVEGALLGQAKPADASLSLAGVQMLAKLQLAVSDQQALLLKENEELWAPSLRLWEDMSADQALPAAFRLGLAQLNHRQRDLARGLTGATIAANGAAAATVLVIADLEAFSEEVARTYGAAIASALPRLREQAGRMAAAMPGDPAVEAVGLILDNLEKTAAGVRLAAGPAPGPGAWRRLCDAAVPPAQAGVWQFTKDFVYNAGCAVAIAGKAAQNAGRFMASGVERSSQRVSQVLAYGTYSPFRVTSDPKALLPAAEEIIKKNPEMAQHREVLTARLEQIAKRHRTDNVNDYLALKKQTIDASVAEYSRGEYGVRALRTGVRYIEEVGAQKVRPAAAWVADRAGKELLGYPIGGVISPFTKGVASMLAGNAYNVVADLPKNVMILMNPKTTGAEKATATYGLAGSVGMSVLCYSGTAAAVAGKVAPRLTAAGKSLFELGGRMVGRIMPQGGRAAARAVAEMVKPVAAQVGRQVAREVSVLRPLEAQAARYVANGIRLGVQNLKEMAAKPVLATALAETREMLGQAAGKLGANAAGGTVAAIQEFSKNFAIRALLEGAANDSFSSQVMQPTLQAVEDRAAPAPAAKDRAKATGQPAASGFSARAAAPEGAAAKPAAAPKATPARETAAGGGGEARAPRRAKPPKDRRDRREARERGLLEKAKRAAARDENPVYGKDRVDSTQVIPETCTIEMVTWLPKFEKWKVRERFHVLGGQVSATTDQTMDYSGMGTKDWGCGPIRYSGQFQGSLKDNVISGTWQIRNHRQDCWSHWRRYKKGAGGKSTHESVRCDWKTRGNSTNRMSYTLDVDGRVRATFRSSGTTHTSYGQSCWPKVAGTTQTSHYNFTWDDPKLPASSRQALRGVWQFVQRAPAEEKQKQ